MMNRKVTIKNAYRSVGDHANFYDGMITCSTFTGKLVCKVVWDMNQDENTEYLERAFRGIPDGFSGKLLEVPVGTGILSMPIYQELPDADITCLDYSQDMMNQAQARAKKLDLKHITFQQGDVGSLPYIDQTFDAVLSLNGFHAFPDKEAAYREIYRVLKDGGVFCGCFYIQGMHKRTDWMIRNIYEPRGYFTGPYETLGSLTQRLQTQYREVEVTNVKSMVCFICRK